MPYYIGITLSTKEAHDKNKQWADLKDNSTVRQSYVYFCEKQDLK